MIPATWSCPLPDGAVADEYALACDRGRTRRLLIVSALFDEANRLRRLTVEVMRRLDGAGIDSILPDLPGCNESRQPLSSQTPESWRAAMAAAAAHFGATRVLAMRGGGLIAPLELRGWVLAPVSGAGILRQMIRARIVASREAGRTETHDGLLAAATAEGIGLSGHRLSAALVGGLQALAPSDGLTPITQEMLGGGGLWLRAEPGDDPHQADALAAIIASAMAS